MFSLNNRNNRYLNNTELMPITTNNENETQPISRRISTDIAAINVNMQLILSINACSVIFCHFWLQISV